MTVDYKRTSIAKGISLTEIYDKKFKSFAAMIKLILPYDRDKFPLWELAAELLTVSCKSYPEKEQFMLAQTELYNANITSSSLRIADSCIFTISLSCISDEYTIGKEKISEKAVSLLLGCLLEPFTENGEFSQKYFELCRSDMLDDIASMINNKRKYSMLRSQKAIFEGEMYSIIPFDNVETLNKATPQSVYEAYRELLSKACCEIFFTGCAVSQSVKKQVLDSILALERDPVDMMDFYSPSPLKDRVCYKEESFESRQAHLYIAFKTKEFDELPVKLFVTMLGSSPTSRLFMNVREKLSLCYYCDASLADSKYTLIIRSGLDPENLDKAKTAIYEQIEAIQKGDFTDEELDNAKTYLAESCLANYDSKYELNTWYFYQYLKGTGYSPEEKARKFREVTREEIIRSARGFALDTVFVMLPENGGEPNEA